MSTVDAVMFLVAAWTACAALSAHSFIPMMTKAEKRTGRMFSWAQFAFIVVFWPLTWLAVAINVMHMPDDGDES